MYRKDNEYLPRSPFRSQIEDEIILDFSSSQNTLTALKDEIYRAAVFSRRTAFLRPMPH
jgi:hypothetical protein